MDNTVKRNGGGYLRKLMDNMSLTNWIMVILMLGSGLFYVFNADARLSSVEENKVDKAEYYSHRQLDSLKRSYEVTLQLKNNKLLIKIANVLGIPHEE